MATTKRIKGIIIDPFTKEVRTIYLDHDANRGTLDALYAAIDCDTVEIGFRWPDTGADLWLDEEGMLRDPESVRMFALVDEDRQVIAGPFAGRAVILGANEEGESIDAPPMAVHVGWVRPENVPEIVERVLSTSPTITVMEG